MPLSLLPPTLPMASSGLSYKVGEGRAIPLAHIESAAPQFLESQSIRKVVHDAKVFLAATLRLGNHAAKSRR